MRDERRGAVRTSHPMQCRCGTVKGVLVNLRNANRTICYCTDCQAFAYALGDASRVLDAQGGSDVVQVLPKDVTFAQGVDALACLRLTPKGLLRWYASCCRTPIGNTLATPKVSFIGLLHSCLQAGDTSLDAAFGPVTAWVHTDGAKGGAKLKDVGLVRSVGWFVRTTLGARLNGDYRLSPLFHPKTGVPIAVPQVLSERDLARVREAVRAASSR